MPRVRRRGVPLDLERIFATRGRDDWAAHFEGTDACVTPVLTFTEAAEHPHLAARGTYLRRDGRLAAAPAPRFGPPSSAHLRARSVPPP